MTLTVVKIGGNVIDSPAELSAFLDDFAKIDEPKVLVHGGGKIATTIAGKLGIESQMVAGRRVTSPEMRDVAVMVYAGLINKRIVAGLQARGCNALGLSGADGMAVMAHKRPASPVDYGEVGDVDNVNGQTLNSLINLGFVPVYCAISCDAEGNLLNTNADTIATEVAQAGASIFKTKLIYCFEKRGVLADVKDEYSVIDIINNDNFEKLRDTGVISGGMLPKVTNALKAVTEYGVNEVIIKSSAELLHDSGTKVVK